VRFLHSTTLLRDGRVLVAGGAMGGGLNEILATAEVYAPATNAWSSVGAMTTPRQRHTATLLGDGRVLVAGGVDSSGRAVNTAEVYEPALNAWLPVGTLATARSGHTATRLGDGSVLVTGGGTNTAEVFDPATNAWSSVGAMATVRISHTATLLGDGKVLVTGGYREDHGAWDLLATSELYDPATRVFSSAGAMSVDRNMHAAAALGDGKVLVVGGYSGFPYASAELYAP
jgi:N-acetylneuraminic acid mutarotase